MSLIDTVFHLTEVLRPYITDPEQLVCLDAIATMPAWKTQRQLDEWENLCIDALSNFEDASLKSYDAKHASLTLLLDEVLEFGRFNLYSAYQQLQTEREYEKLLLLFNEHNIEGIKPLSDVDLSGW